MEGNANNSSIKRGGKHEPVNIVQHQKITEAIKAQSEVERIMAETRESNFEELDEILGVLDSGRRRSSVQENYQERISTRFSEEPRKSTPTADVEAMRRKSTSGNKTSNKRTTTTFASGWKKAAMATTLAAIVFVGGVKLSEPIMEQLALHQNEWELYNGTRTFKEMVKEDYTTTTFTGDTQIEYDKLADHLESDGIIDNRELYTMVASLGEVQANRVLSAAENAPAENVEEYMRSNNITSTEDWQEKTARQMLAEEQIADAKKDLEAIFKDVPATPTIEQTESYGGK